MESLSIIIPVYNESKRITSVLTQLDDVIFPIPTQIIIVDDCSTDGSLQKIKDYLGKGSSNVTVLQHSKNKGKGAAIRSGIKSAQTSHVIFQDADLELLPKEIPLLIAPILNNDADVVYGSRFMTYRKRSLSTLANKLLTTLSNRLFGLTLTDMETCYKLVPMSIINQIELKENRFGFEPEITAKLSKFKSLRWKEVPISYLPRNLSEGKKIGWKDGIRAIYCILKYR